MGRKIERYHKESGPGSCRDIAAHMGRLTQSFEASADCLMSQTNDWAVWNEMYRYALKPKAEWAKENVGLNALAPADLSLIMVYAKNGRLLSAITSDPTSEKRIIPADPYLAVMKKGERKAQCGIVMTEAGLLLTCWAGIVQSDGKGDVAGTVIMGRLLEPSRLLKLRLQTNLSFDLHTEPNMPQGLTKWSATLKPGIIGGSEFWTSFEPTIYHLYYPVQDILKQDVGLITFDVSRTVHEQALVLYEQVRLQLLWTALIMTILLGLAVDFLLTHRLRRFAKQLDALSENSKWDTRIGIGGGDELGLVARNVNKLLTLIQSQVESLNALSMIDALTGLYNRRAFNEKLAHEHGRSRRSGKLLALLILDVDHFKRYNDRYGHPAGDEVLKTLAVILNASIRNQTDFAARIGGEEFAILLPETTPSGAVETAERIRANLSERQMEHADSPVGPHITISIGIAFVGEDAIDDFVIRADRAMYKSKEEGRNRVYCESAEVVQVT